MDTQNIQVCEGDLTGYGFNDPTYWNMLEQHEQQYASLISNPKTHLSYVEIHARLRILLAETINSKPEQLRILKGDFGKPYLADYPELAFNLSHSGNKYVIVMGYYQDLGVDIEICKPRKTLSALVEKCFANEEQEFWMRLPESEQTKAFYRFWTRKEAFVKAVGRGIALGLNRCVVNPDEPNRFLRLPKEYGQPQAWHIQEINVENSFCAAYVSRPVTPPP